MQTKENKTAHSEIKIEPQEITKAHIDGLARQLLPRMLAELQKAKADNEPPEEVELVVD